MGTRHLILVYYKGAYHIAQYGSHDGYPSGNGAIVLEFIQDPENLVKLKRAIDGGLVYTATKEVYARLEAEIAELNRVSPEKKVSFYDVYLSLAVDSAKILPLVANAMEPIPIRLELEFIWDTVFCEWAYVVDLDKDVFEVFGYPEDDSLLRCSSRFANRSRACCGVWALDSLPSKAQFIELLYPEVEEVEEEEEEEED